MARRSDGRHAWFVAGYQDALRDIQQRWDEGGPEAALKWIEDNMAKPAQPTAALLERYHANDDDDEALEELHKRAMAGDLQAREVLNDYDRDDPGWTPQTGSEGRD